ncbi:MAG: class I SAM-dependent methyltransferase [Candidatus Omnitrophica bacterium]|nr:class I SAM-dependent methyltransferase [Candidatus Omnitrophota bacterium]
MDMKTDYTKVTELPGQRGSEEQIERLFHRYCFARQYCDGKDVLEVACGGGIGLGYLSKKAKRIVGIDIEEGNLIFAEQLYENRNNIETKIMDAHHFDFDNETFDVVILYEALYYLKDPDLFFKEAHRVLRKGGHLIIGTVNKEWDDFNPSPYSVRYFSGSEIQAALQPLFQIIHMYGAFSTIPTSAKDVILSSIKRAAVSLHMMPKTMKGKEFLKKIFFGKLVPLPKELSEHMSAYTSPQPVVGNNIKEYKVLYAVASK